MIAVRAAHECVLAIVGSVYKDAPPEVVGRVKAEIVAAFDRHDPRHFVSGGAPGVDTWAEEEARRRGMTGERITIHMPKNARWAPDGYKDRNILIAIPPTEHLVRIFDPASKTFGSGWTANYAEQRGIQVERISAG